eukprot:6204190-Pleurochrysis_carterae.AAC.1
MRQTTVIVRQRSMRSIVVVSTRSETAFSLARIQSRASPNNAVCMCLSAKSNLAEANVASFTIRATAFASNFAVAVVVGTGRVAVANLPVPGTASL